MEIIKMLTEDEALIFFKDAVRERAKMNLPDFFCMLYTNPDMLEEDIGHSDYVYLTMLLPFVQ